MNLKKILWMVIQNVKNKIDIYVIKQDLILLLYLKLASVGAQTVKNLPANAGDPGSILGSERSPGEENGYLLLENPVDRGPWWATYSSWGCKE